MGDRKGQLGGGRTPEGGPAAADAPSGSPLARKFVRITGRRAPFVEFEFAIGSPDLHVDLVLPEPAFAAFCRENDVVILEGARTPDANDWSMRRAALGAVPEEP